MKELRKENYANVLFALQDVLDMAHLMELDVPRFEGATLADTYTKNGKTLNYLQSRVLPDDEIIPDGIPNHSDTYYRLVDEVIDIIENVINNGGYAEFSPHRNTRGEREDAVVVVAYYKKKKMYVKLFAEYTCKGLIPVAAYHLSNSN